MSERKEHLSKDWSMERQAAEIKRLKSLLNAPGDAMSLKSRLAREAEYVKDRIVETVRWFWRGGGSMLERSGREGQVGLNIGPKPNAPTEEALQFFVSCLNYSMPHPFDDDRFSRFIVVAHQQDSQWDEDEVRKYLTERYRLPDEMAKKYAAKYAVGRKALLKQKRMEIDDNSPVW